ncbi:MAG TPA: OmpH family outer membrane protein [Planctomycetaceae bacterium]
MKKWLLFPTLAVAYCGALALSPHARGQAGATTARGARPALKIAVLDMGQLLRQYKKTVGLREEINASGEASNTKLKEMYGKGQELIQSLKDGSIEPGSPKFRERELEIYRLESYIKTAKSSAEKDLKRQELKASVEVYNEIQDVLKLFCEHNGFTVILRIDNEGTAATDPQALGRALSQNIIYHQHRDDITSSVVAYLNRRYESSAQAESATGLKSSPAASQPATSAAPPRKSNSR